VQQVRDGRSSHGTPRARQREELKSTLLASLGHDLRTPLTTIRMAASNLQGSWLTADDRREQGDLVLAEVERLSRVFQNILEMARLDAGAVRTGAQWVHPSEIVEAARDHVQHAIRDPDIDLQAESDCVVQLDPRLTALALAYLLENAAQYAPAASPIVVRLEVTTAGLTICVRDHGPGIRPVDLRHVFERFYRGADAKRSAPGIGMGLAIVQGIVTAERGRVWAENCADGGAQFTLIIPAAQRVASPAAAS
jgi:two-component system sensor histidine kinase KdpD